MPSSIERKEHKRDSERFKIERDRGNEKPPCSSGYHKDGYPWSAIHHIVPVTSVADGTIFDQLGQDFGDFMVIFYCLGETDWDINATHNTIGLPLKLAFVYKLPDDWDGHACHEVEHNPYYTDAVSAYMKRTVWNPSLKKAENCEFKAESLESGLKAASDYWRNFLTVTRGKGTKTCWNDRAKLPNTWYIPFSMNPGTPLKRKAPPDWSSFSGKLAEYLEQMFTVIR